MSAATDAIKTLEAAKTVLQKQAATAVGATLTGLELAIDAIATEIGALVTAALAEYVPQTAAFKAATADAKAFVARLNGLKAAFADVAELAGVIDRVIGLIK